MTEYLCDVYILIEAAFKNWVFDKLFVPIFLAVLTGYFVSNVLTFRDLLRRSIDEIEFMNRKIMETGGGLARKTRHDWILLMGDHNQELYSIRREMEQFGFPVSAEKLGEIANRLFYKLAVAYGMYDSVDVKSTKADGFDEKMDERLTEKMWQAIADFFRDEHSAWILQIRNLRPAFLELINAPTLAKFGFVGAFVRLFTALAVWIDRKYSPCGSDCGNRCDQCNRTI